MAVPVLVYGSETWTLKKKNWTSIQAAEIPENYRRLLLRQIT
jgi:hypothetical protein